MKKRIAVIVTGLLALVGCGGGNDWKPTCSASKPCAAGNYCAETPDGNVCWPDAVDPVISRVQATCGGSTTCRRDATLRVEVDATDDAKMGTVQAELSLDPGHPRTLQLVSGSTYAVDVSLTSIPFPHFEQEVSVAVTVRDDAGNGVNAIPKVTVTRSAWARQVTTVPLLSPAILHDGRVAVSATNGRLHFLNTSGVASTPVTVTSSLLNGPPAVGSDTVWVGSEDGKLYPVSVGGTVGNSCSAGPTLGAPVISGSKAISATKSSRIVVADTTGICNSTVLTSPAQPVMGAGGRLFVPAGGKLRSYTVFADGALADDWTGSPPSPDIGEVTSPPAIDGQGSVWTTAAGAVYRTTPAGIAQQVTFAPALPTSSGGAVTLADGSVVITGGSSEVLRRTGSSGWTASPQLTGRPAIPLAVAGETPALLVATDMGWLYLLSQLDGTVIWSQRLTPADQSLQPPNIWTEPNATTSTAYLAGADGYLYAVIVDGKLDTSAPWPKAYHDPQNTSNAGVTP